MIEVSDAVIENGFDRQGADELLGKIAQRLENEKPADGYDIADCYDLIHHQPLPDYRQAYEHVKKELTDMGLTFG